MDKSIGGYFELELPQKEEYHKGLNLVRLNTGRNAIEYILKAKRYKKVYLPFFACDTMLEPIHKLGISYQFYAIDEGFNPIFDFGSIKKKEVLVYINYFGLCDRQVNKVATLTNNLIIDNSQAFYSKPLPNIDTFYSPRKFFGISDGAYLYTNRMLSYELVQDQSFRRLEPLIGRIDTTAEEHFIKARIVEQNLSNVPIKTMSNFTQRMLSSFEYATIAAKRQANFNFLDERLGSISKIKIETISTSVPMIYPLLLENGQRIKNFLIENRVYVATYWPNVLKWSDKASYEYYLTQNLVSLPIDQRYTLAEMKKIKELVINYI